MDKSEKRIVTEVTYEVIVKESRRAYMDFASAMFKYEASCSCYGLFGASVAMVKLKPAAAQLFRETCKPFDMKYRSPTVFDNGTLVAIYASPEDEIADVKTPSSLHVIAKQDK